jgi:hypothetical protein
MLVAPAALGDESTHIVHRAWKVELNWSGEKRSVEPGATFRHCPGDEVSTLYFSGKMVHPSRRNVEYTVYWSHNGRYDGQIDRSTYRHGRIRESWGVEGIPGEDEGFEDGRWTARFGGGYLGDHPIGKSSITLRTVAGPDC